MAHAPEEINGTDSLLRHRRLIEPVISEPGSDVAHELWAAPYRAASSVLAFAEGMAALAAGHRNSRLPKGLHAEAILGFERAYEQLAAIGVDERLARSAGALALFDPPAVRAAQFRRRSRAHAQDRLI
jgi:hypothetical protein